MKKKKLSEYADNTSNIVCTIPENTEINLIDDLDETIKKENLTVDIILEAGSTLLYRSRIIDTKREILAGKPLKKTELSSERKLQKKVSFIFNGKGAQADIRYAYFGGKRRAFKLVTIQNHKVADTKSNLVVRGVFEGESTFFCDNLIRIDKDAQHVSAHQVNKNLLLSDSARAISIPKLEVLAHDVQCSHGAATSRLDEDHLFYMQSRGLSKNVAQEMMIQAFLSF